MLILLNQALNGKGTIDIVINDQNLSIFLPLTLFGQKVVKV